MKALRYTRTAIALHWVHAAIVLGLLAWGLYMVGLPQGDARSWAFGVHKSFGLVALALIAVRGLWRAFHPAPRLDGVPEGERRLAAGTHRLLYALLFAVPLVGLASVSFTKYPLKFFGMPLPKLGWPDKALNELFSGVHHFLAWTLAAVIVLHVAAAARHLIRRDGIAERMLPGARRSLAQR